MNEKEDAVRLIKEVLGNVNPLELLPSKISWKPDQGEICINGEKITIAENAPVYITGFGKASASMALALESILENRIHEGVVIAPPGITSVPNKTRVLEGSHPLPDSKSITSTQQLLTFADQIPDHSIVINLISGGASSLFCAPVPGLTVQHIQILYRLLLESGASIHEINTVRKAFSEVKAGRFLDRFRHTILIDLIISDVPGDDRKYIGGGPTTAQEISFREAADILKKYSLFNKIPGPAKARLLNELEKETTAGGPRQTREHSGHFSFILASARILVEEAARLLTRKGYKASASGNVWNGSMEDFEINISTAIDNAISSEETPLALLFFGECTVKVTGNGLGGRNQELALRMAKRLRNFDRKIIFLSAGTDGIDGPTDAAGAIVDQNTYEDALRMGINPETYLSSNNSYHFFKKCGGHISTGPTGNNLMDLQVVLIY